MVKHGSIVELTDLIQKYKQEVFWESLKLRKKFDNFYKRQSKLGKHILSEYKGILFKELNIFLFDRELYFSHFDKSLFNIINNAYNKKKKLDKDELKQKIISNIFYVVYKEIKNVIEIDKLFKNAPKLEEDIFVYRGLNFKEQEFEQKLTEQLKSLKKGDTYINPNYLSTSLLNQTALDFMESKFIEIKKARCCLFKIFVPKGTRFLYLDSNIEGNVQNDKNLFLFSEFEVLLPRASILKFKKEYTISGKLPMKCKIENLSKGKITDILVYEFDYMGYDKNREKFTDKDLSKEFITNIITKFKYTNLKVTQYDISAYSKTSDINELSKEYKKEVNKK